MPLSFKQQGRPRPVVIWAGGIGDMVMVTPLVACLQERCGQAQSWEYEPMQWRTGISPEMRPSPVIALKGSTDSRHASEQLAAARDHVDVGA